MGSWIQPSAIIIVRPTPSIARVAWLCGVPNIMADLAPRALYMTISERFGAT